MGTHTRSEAVEKPPRQSEGSRFRPVSLFLFENLAIAGGYVLLGWLGELLRLEGRLLIVWPAAGFALAMLVLRGASRWPGILLGSALVAQHWLFEAGTIPAFRAGAAAVLTGAACALSSVVGAQLIRRFVGKAGWPCSVRCVIGTLLIGGLVYPALAAAMTYCALLAGGDRLAISAALRDLWTWAVINSTGTTVVAPLILALAMRPIARPYRSRWEAALLGMLYVTAGLIPLGFARGFGLSGVLTYPTTPLMLWATLRFGARGASFNNLVWATVVIWGLFMDMGAAGFTQEFFMIQLRVLVLSGVVLVLAGAVEERHQMQEALEQERRGLERRVAERTRELARSLSLLHSSLESTADGLLVVDRMGHITAMNRRFAQLWGIPSSILESGDDARALAFAREQVADPEVFLSRVAYLYEHPEQESADEFRLRDGRIFERYSRPQLLGKEIIGRVWSFRDVTSRRRAEAERDRLLVEAQRALGLRDEFLAIAAHEMKTPVTSMKVQVQHLERLLASEPLSHQHSTRLKAMAATASRQLRRLQALGDQMLDVTRLTLGRIDLHYEPLDLREVVEEQLELQAEAIARAGSELRFECSGPIPGEWDRLRLEQIVCNLLSNAIKFGAGKPIIVRLEASGSRAHIQVIDYGIGIASEDHQRIFERLERAVDSMNYGGLGMGLWIVQQSVEALGGDITVESAPRQGSTFTIELPRTPLSSQRTRTSTRAGEAEAFASE